MDFCRPREARAYATRHRYEQACREAAAGALTGGNEQFRVFGRRVENPPDRRNLSPVTLVNDVAPTGPNLGTGERGDYAMSFICYVHRLDAGTPYMEVLGATELSEAEILAAQLLHDRPSCRMVEIFEDDVSVARLTNGRHA